MPLGRRYQRFRPIPVHRTAVLPLRTVILPLRIAVLAPRIGVLKARTRVFPYKDCSFPYKDSVLIGEDWNYYYSKQKEIGLVAPHNALMLNLFPKNCLFI